ncbi:MAG: hypothetical protein CMA58_03565 [Euryarchaeota archaeon]|jgi:hypothetical protein|nr:hypothetical protein [Euryarchaeota archaeon]
MARSDSMLWFILGFAQLIVANQAGGGILEFLELMLNITGGSSLVVGIYVLLYVAKHSEELADVYSKFEKSELTRDENGSLTIRNGDSPVKKGVGIGISAAITVFAGIVWLATL